MDNDKNGGNMADLLNLPQYIIDLEKSHQGVQFGEVGPMRFKKANGRVVGFVLPVTNSLRFKANEEVLLYLLDMIKSLPESSGQIDLSIKYKQGVVHEISTTTYVQKEYEQ